MKWTFKAVFGFNFHKRTKCQAKGISLCASDDLNGLTEWK